jgi:hypothetical protein
MIRWSNRSLAHKIRMMANRPGGVGNEAVSIMAEGLDPRSEGHVSRLTRGQQLQILSRLKGEVPGEMTSRQRWEILSVLQPILTTKCKHDSAGTVLWLVGSRSPFGRMRGAEIARQLFPVEAVRAFAPIQTPDIVPFQFTIHNPQSAITDHEADRMIEGMKGLILSAGLSPLQEIKSQKLLLTRTASQ